MNTDKKRRISKNGIELIKKFESCVLEAYQCSAGVWTIGWGHTGYDVFKGMKITEAEAERLLERDVRVFENAVNSAIRISLSQNEFDALVSLAFNIGIGAFNNSTLVKKLNNGKRGEAAHEFLRWNKARLGEVVKPLEGLTRRRVVEKALFEKPDLVG